MGLKNAIDSTLLILSYTHLKCFPSNISPACPNNFMIISCVSNFNSQVAHRTQDFVNYVFSPLGSIQWAEAKA